MSFWEILDIPTGTQDARVIKKAFLKMSLIYHPDKGGEDMTFAFIGMVQEVLSDPYKRFQYEHGGHQAFTDPFAAGASENSEAKEDTNTTEGWKPYGDETKPTPKDPFYAA